MTGTLRRRRKGEDEEREEGNVIVMRNERVEQQPIGREVCMDRGLGWERIGMGREGIEMGSVRDGKR